MTTPAAHDLGPPDISPPRSGSLEARASFVLKVLAAINVAGIVLAMLPQPLPQSVLETSVLNVAAAALALLEIVMARALDRRRPWAVAVVSPVLALLIAAGVGAMLVAAQAGRTRVPFEAVFAIWALLGARDRALDGRADRRAVLAAAGTLLLLVSIVGRHALFGWGGLVDAPSADLRGTLSADCGAASASPPDAITVAYDWSWARTSPLPSGLDMVVLGWSAPDAGGRPLYYYDATPPTGPGIYAGRRDYPSEDMASEVAATSRASFSWGVELGEQGMRPGRVVLHLVRAQQAPQDPRPLVITASYIHLGVWHTDAAAVTCAWSAASAVR